MYLKHPLEGQSKTAKRPLENYVRSDMTFFQAELTNCHQPCALSYVAPRPVYVGDVQIASYHVPPYDEEEIARHQEKSREL